MKQTFSLIGIFLAVSLGAQNKELPTSGPIISNYGDTYTVSQIDFKTDVLKPYKVVFDVNRNFNNPNKPNPLFETAARFLNMHHKVGVPLKNIGIALVVHGDAAKDLLSTNAYRAEFGSTVGDNPNLLLISELTNNDVEIILCGQTAANMGISKPMIHPNVQIALSAMTALVQLQNEGYRVINF